MSTSRGAANPSFAWLWEDKTLADATLLLHVCGQPSGAASPAALRVHRAVLGAHSEHFRTIVLGWADGDSQRAVDFQPAIAVAHYIKSGSLPEGLTAHQLAQVCKEAKAREKLQCAEACSQALVALVVEEAGNPQPVLPCLEETFDSLEMCDAARLVVRCMYEGGLAEEVKDPPTLARMCCVTKRWALSSITASCLQRLMELSPSQLPAEQLVRVLKILPGNGIMQPERYGWQEHVRSLIVGWYGDVHKIITWSDQRRAFQELPYAALQQWAGSDDLTVDSENSVVELISLWMAGLEGWSCSQQQKQQLSCLVRVPHLSPAYALGRLPALDWFDIPGASTATVAQAAYCGFGMTGVVVDTNKAPPAWSAAPRKQLDPDELLQRTTIRWCVTSQQLVGLLASKDLTYEIASEPVYASGVGWRVCVDLQKRTQAPTYPYRQEHALGRNATGPPQGAKDEPGSSLSCCGQLVTYVECDGYSLGAPLEHGTPINYALLTGCSECPSENWTFAWGKNKWGRSSSVDEAIKKAADCGHMRYSTCGALLQITSAFKVVHKA